MVQFGAGSELAAQCPIVPPPDGWRSWTDANGPLPEALAARAAAIASDVSLPLGVTESYPLPGVTTLIRLEPRVWGRDANGALVQGCFRAGGVYLPDAAPSERISAPETDGTSKAVGIFTVISLAVGTVATLASMGSR
jgi:hypothetical protein